MKATYLGASDLQYSHWMDGGGFPKVGIHHACKKPAGACGKNDTHRVHFDGWRSVTAEDISSKKVKWVKGAILRKVLDAVAEFDPCPPHGRGTTQQ